jgi:putative MATE family efflux protein
LGGGGLFVAGRGMRGILLRLAWPVVAERISLTLLAAVDALLVGRYVGADAMAAVGLGGLWMWLPLVGAMGAEIGATALVARDVGAGSPRSAVRSVDAAILAALAWGLGTAVLMVVAAPLLMRLMGAEAAVAPLGAEYLRPALVGLPLMLVMYAANGALRGMGNTVGPMLVLFAVNIVNLAVAFLLISGVIGVELGVTASGIGYGAAGVTGGVLALGLLVRNGGGIGYRPSLASLRPGWQATRRFLRLALPVSLDELQFIAAFLLYTRIIAGAGTSAVAAHTVALRTMDVAIMPGFALGTAATTLVGQGLGMQRPDLAQSAARTAWSLTGVLTVCGAVLLALFSPWIAALFVSDPEVVDTAATLMRIFALAMPAIGLTSSFAGALRGAGDVRYILGVTTITTWCVRIPVALLGTAVLGWGAPGAWMGAVVDNNLRGLLIARRFASGRWKHLRV